MIKMMEMMEVFVCLYYMPESGPLSKTDLDGSWVVIWLTHFLLATLIASTFDTGLSLLLGFDQGILLIAIATRTTLDSAALPLDGAMTMYTHGTSRAHGLGRRSAAADVDVAIHAFNGTGNNRQDNCIVG